MVDRPLYYLVSPAGVPNYGDEIIALTWLRYLATAAPGADVVVDCIDPENAARTLTGIHPRLRFTDTLWQLCRLNWAYGARHAATTVERAVLDPGSAGHLAAGFELLGTADIVHLVGGGFINDIWPPFTGLLAGVSTAGRRPGVRAVMTGQGMWPPPADAADLIPELARQLDVLDVRDDSSARLLASGRVTVSGDDAFLGLAPELYDRSADAPDVMVSVQSQLSDLDTDQLLIFIGDTVRAWGAKSVGLLECFPEQDAKVLDRAATLLPVTRRYGLHEVLRDGLPVASGQAWLTTRFHPHLVAAAGGASGVAVNIRRDYYDTKHRSLLECGSRWSLSNAAEIPARPTAGGYPPEQVEAVRAAKRAVADRIYGA
ncbi:polysaccharide pyruvyl transferase family protein [Actinoplanes sp. NPDC049548]|uniref:polysaccharide pyruvyl transferase family protein n=1 Tax=Actinoplanes sp. NPDC049548 TaxID=3155152 RepID=UPI003439216D